MSIIRPRNTNIPFTIAVFFVLASIFFHPNATASPLDRALIPADSAWLIHFDLDAVRNSSLSTPIAMGVLSNPDVLEGIESIEEVTGIDPMEDVNSVTFFGNWKTPGEGVVLIRTEADLAQFREAITYADDYKASKSGDHPIHSFKEKGQTLHLCFHGEHLIAICRNIENLQTALQVFDGLKPNLGDTAQGFFGSNEDVIGHEPLGAVTFAATNVSELEEMLLKKTNSPVVKLIDSAALILGETGEGSDRAVFVRLTLEMESDEAAADVKDVAEGMIAAVRLHFNDSPDILKNIKRAVVEPEGHRVVITGNWPTRELIIAIQKELMKQLSENN